MYLHSDSLDIRYPRWTIVDENYDPLLNLSPFEVEQVFLLTGARILVVVTSRGISAFELVGNSLQDSYQLVSTDKGLFLRESE